MDITASKFPRLSGQDVYLIFRLIKDRKDQFDRSCEEWRRMTWSQVGREYPTYDAKKKKTNLFAHNLR